MKKIKSNEIINNILINLLSKYKNISDYLITFIVIYYLKNKNKFNGINISVIQQKLNYESIIEQLFKEINKLIIKKEQFFIEEENNDFFILLKGIQELNCCNSLSDSYYLSNIKI